MFKLDVCTANTNFEYARESLIWLKSFGIDAAICGGWLRDIDNNIKPKDIDIFVIGDIKYEEVFNPDTVKDIDGHWYGRYEGSNMRDDVNGVLKLDNNTLDVIFMKQKSWEEVLGNFDVSVCQILCKLDNDNNMKVYCSDSYLEFKKTGKPVRFMQVDTCDGHINRIRKKFGSISYNYESTDSSMNLYGTLAEGGIAYD